MVAEDRSTGQNETSPPQKVPLLPNENFEIIMILLEKYRSNGKVELKAHHHRYFPFVLSSAILTSALSIIGCIT